MKKMLSSRIEIFIDILTNSLIVMAYLMPQLLLEIKEIYLLNRMHAIPSTTSVFWKRKKLFLITIH